MQVVIEQASKLRRGKKSREGRCPGACNTAACSGTVSCRRDLMGRVGRGFAGFSCVAPAWPALGGTRLRRPRCDTVPHGPGTVQDGASSTIPLLVSMHVRTVLHLTDGRNNLNINTYRAVRQRKSRLDLQFRFQSLIYACCSWLLARRRVQPRISQTCQKSKPRLGMGPLVVTE